MNITLNEYNNNIKIFISHPVSHDTELGEDTIRIKFY